MLCERCHKRKAEVIFIEVVGNKKRNMLLCNECAQQLSIGYVPGKAVIEKELPVDVNKTCSYCGLTYREYRAKNRFGCAQCYTTFIDAVLQDLEKLHGSTQYRGHPYERNQNLFIKFEEIVALEHQLKTALSTEDFEQAANIRDKIKNIETKIQEML